MILLFNHVPEVTKTLPLNQIGNYLQQCRQNRFTGLIHIGNPPDPCAVLTFSQGTLLQQGVMQGEIWREIGLTQILQFMPGKNSIVSTLPLPPEGIRIVRALLEWFPPQITLLAMTADLPDLLNGWGQEPLRSVVRITWPDAEGFVLLPGKEQSPAVIYTTTTRIKSGAAALNDDLYGHPNQPCSVARYMAPPEIADPQIELEALKNAFAALLNHLVLRYGRLVGTTLAQTLFAEIKHQAQKNNWAIEVTQTGLKDETGSTDTESTAQIYHTLLGEVSQTIEEIIGPRMTRTLVQEAALELPPATREVLRRQQIIELPPP